MQTNVSVFNSRYLLKKHCTFEQLSYVISESIK